MFDRLATEKDTLRGFVNDTKAFIDELLSEKQSFRIVPSLLATLRTAWLSPTMAARFQQLLAQVNLLGSDQISNHGLGGIDLDAKIDVIKYLHSRFLLRGGSHLLKRLIDAIDNLLESILDAAGFGSAIKELKDAVKEAIDED